MDNLQVIEVYDSATVDSILDVVKSIEEPRWITREYLQPGRAVDNETCCYKYCNQVQMKKQDREYFRNLAPKFENYFLSEVAVNRYDRGDFIGLHRDRHEFRMNLVVSLQDSSDGLYVRDTDEFIEDKAGQGVQIIGTGPVHSVPTTNNERYSLIFLYE